MKLKRIFAWSLLIGSTVGWLPLHFYAVSLGEPAVVVDLSIGAIWLTALDGVWIQGDKRSCSKCGNVE